MGRKIFARTCILAISKSQLMGKLKQFGTLQQVTSPLMQFTPIGREIRDWDIGKPTLFKLKLLGIPLGYHTVKVTAFDQDAGLIETQECSRAVPVWNHRITVSALGPNQVQYTDRIEVEAGPIIGIVMLWVKVFFAHRQRKLRRLVAT